MGCMIKCDLLFSSGRDRLEQSGAHWWTVSTYSFTVSVPTGVCCVVIGIRSVRGSVNLDLGWLLETAGTGSLIFGIPSAGILYTRRSLTTTRVLLQLIICSCSIWS